MVTVAFLFLFRCGDSDGSHSCVALLPPGALFFYLNDTERALQKANNDTDMTWVDCLFFCTVVSTTVG